MHDVTIKGGRLIDPGQGIDGYFDVGIKDGRVATIQPTIEVDNTGRSIDATGKIVTPGLVDLHTHVYWGATIWGIDVNQIAPVSGTTTFVDAGTAGAYTFAGLRKFIIEPATPRVLAYLNISSIGLAHFTYEVSNLSYVDPDVAMEAVKNNREYIVGIKVRIDALTTGDYGVLPLQRAVDTAESLKLPVMVHIGKRPPVLSDIISQMRPGDVLTHCYTGGPGKNQLVDEDGQVHDFVRQAVNDGIVLDIGHGVGSFSYESAEKLFDQGIIPDAISTDVHQFSVAGPMLDLPTTMSKFLNLGLPLPDVIEKTTVAPARAIGRDLGTLRVGQPADVAAFELREGDFEFGDATGVRRSGRLKLENAWTMVSGEILPEPSASEVEEQEHRVMAKYLRDRLSTGALLRWGSPTATTSHQ